MIYLFTGTPGSGKSLDVARVIKNKLRAKQPVICNFPVNERYVKILIVFILKKMMNLQLIILLNLHVIISLENV